MVFGTVIFITAPFFLLFSILFVNALPIGLVKEGFGGIFTLLSFFFCFEFVIIILKKKEVKIFATSLYFMQQWLRFLGKLKTN